MTPTKDEIRRAMTELKRGTSDVWRRDAGRAVQERILGLEEFRAAATIGCYLSMSLEAPLGEVIENAWRGSRGVCVPGYRAETGRYGLRRLTPQTEIRMGKGRVPEPADGEWVDLEEVDLVLVPGMAFDPAGGRVGRGGGHYDRLLAGAARGRSGPFKLGVAFDLQVLDSVPVGELDVRMDAVVTELRTIRSKP